MRYILYSILLSVALLSSSCEENVIFEENDNFSDFGYSTSLMERINSVPTWMYGLERYEVACFMDLSQGAVSTKWTVNDPSDGSKFIYSGFDTSKTDFTDNIIPGLTNVCTDELIFIWHSEAAEEIELTIEKEFLYPVSFDYYETLGSDSSELLTKESTYNPSTGYHDFSYTFTYKVYDKLGVDCVVYPTTDNTDYVYWVLHSDDDNLESVVLPKGSYIVEITKVYGDPTAISFSNGDSYSSIPATPFTTSLVDDLKISLSRSSSNKTPSNNRSVTLPITIEQ